MTAGERLAQYLQKKGIVQKQKVKQKSNDITTAAKQKDLIINIAKSLGYLD